MSLSQERHEFVTQDLRLANQLPRGSVPVCIASNSSLPRVDRGYAVAGNDS